MHNGLSRAPLPAFVVIIQMLGQIRMLARKIQILCFEIEILTLLSGILTQTYEIQTQFQ